MAILSSSTALSCYHVDGTFTDDISGIVEKGLQKYKITDIDGDTADSVFGWTSQENPFSANFEGRSFVVGSFFIFSLRMDKKVIPAMVLKKHVAIETEKRLAASGKDSLSKQEKKQLIDAVRNNLLVRIPSTPTVVDIFWNFEEQTIYLCSAAKTMNEIFETLFKRTFDVPLIRLFPYTIAAYKNILTPGELDTLHNLRPTLLKE